MDTGLSIFGEAADSVPVKTIDQDEDGDDYLEEHNRKREELGAQLKGAFDDLSENSEDESFNSSGQSDNDESPRVPPSDYYGYDTTPLSRVPPDKYAYQNGVDGHSKSHNVMFNGDHHAGHHGISNGNSPTEDSRGKSPYHHLGYDYDSGHLNGNSHSPDDGNQYRQADLGSQEQLMIMYRARVLDVKRLTDAIEALRHDKDSEIDALKRQVLVVETEKQGAVISLKESHHLLANRETQINSLQQKLDQLETLNKNLEKDNCEFMKEISLLRSSSADLQQKVTLLERNGNTIVPSEKQMEAFYKAIQQRHESQVRDLQSQLENTMFKLENKEGECVILEERLRNLTRAHDALQVAKAETVNNLAAQLEEAQRKIQSLASSSAVHEMTKLQVLLEQTINEKKALEEKLAVTSEKLGTAERDLLQYESANRLGLFNSDDSSHETDSITQLGISRRHSLSGKFEKQADKSQDSHRSKRSSADQEDLTSKLQTELHRALQGQHSKRAEIRRLQDQLSAKEKKIKSMLEKEQIYLTESKKYEANLSGILERMKRDQDDLKKAHKTESEFRARCEELQKDLQKAKEEVGRFHVVEKDNASLREKLRVLQEEEKERQLGLLNYNEALKRAKEEIPPAVEKDLIDLRVRLEQSQKECEEMKQLYIQMSAEKRELLTRYEDKDTRLVNELKTMKTERDEFEAHYRECKQIIENLKGEQYKLQKSLDEARLASSQKNFNEIEKVIEESEVKCRQLQERITVLEMENSQKNDLESECLRLREELSAIPTQHQKELERISQELTRSRERVIQLERKLREEFHAQIDSMTSEIDLLRKQIDQKNQLLEEYAQALSRIKPPTKDAAVETANDEGLQKKAAALALQLEKAEERHRNVVETLRQEFDRRLAAQEKEMKAAHDRQLVLIAARYKTEIAAIEDQLKDDAAKYFAEEVTALQEKHIQEHNAVIKRMRESESVLANHIESLKKSLQERIKEVEELNKKVGSGNCDDIKQLQQQIDSERDKMAEMLNCWAAEVQGLRNQVTTLSDELSAVRAKYKEMKKLAIHYKKQVVQVRQGQKEGLQRTEAGYREALYRVKERVMEVVENQEKERRRSLDEKLFENQLLDLAAKQRNLN